MSKRLVEKIREEIKRYLSEILEYEARDPRLESITVMDVRLSSDLHHATVYVSALGGEQDEAIMVLREHRGFFRSELAKRLKLRHTPELHFEPDPAERHARRIDELLKEEGERQP
jgi:ribosome-binding factor A